MKLSKEAKILETVYYRSCKSQKSIYIYMELARGKSHSGKHGQRSYGQRFSDGGKFLKDIITVVEDYDEWLAGRISTLGACV